MTKNIVDIKKLACMTPLDAVEHLGNIGKYNEQAEQFLHATDSTLQVRYLRTGLYFGETDPKQTRDIYEFRLSRGGREYVDTFGDSLQNTWDRFAKFIPKSITYGSPRRDFEKFYLGEYSGKGLWEKENERLSTWDYDTQKPNEYNILASLAAYEPPATFDDFIAEYGYEITSKNTYENALRTYEAVKNQYAKLCALYNEKEMQALATIA